jgi:WD40 repeat protein
MIVLEEKKVLLSASADQNLRFWDLYDMSSSSQPTFLMYADHPKGDSITALGTTTNNDYVLIGDTSGNLKLWNFQDFVFGKDHTSENIHVEWFITAHKSMINSIQICEAFNTDNFIVTASNDHNIFLHRLSNGVFIG